MKREEELLRLCKDCGKANFLIEIQKRNSFFLLRSVKKDSLSIKSEVEK